MRIFEKISEAEKSGIGNKKESVLSFLRAVSDFQACEACLFFQRAALPNGSGDHRRARRGGNPPVWQGQSPCFAGTNIEQKIIPKKKFEKKSVLFVEKGRKIDLCYRGQSRI
jgi:hypothetical protein